MGVIAAKQWDHVKEAVKFGLRVSLNDRFEFSEKGFYGVAADEKGLIPNPEGAMDTNVFCEPGRQPTPHQGFLRKFCQDIFRPRIGCWVKPFCFHEF